MVSLASNPADSPQGLSGSPSLGRCESCSTKEAEKGKLRADLKTVHDMFSRIYQEHSEIAERQEIERKEDMIRFLFKSSLCCRYDAAGNRENLIPRNKGEEFAIYSLVDTNHFYVSTMDSDIVSYMLPDYGVSTSKPVYIGSASVIHPLHILNPLNLRISDFVSRSDGFHVGENSRNLTEHCVSWQQPFEGAVREVLDKAFCQKAAKPKFRYEVHENLSTLDTYRKKCDIWNELIPANLTGKNSIENNRSTVEKVAASLKSVLKVYSESQSYVRFLHRVWPFYLFLQPPTSESDFVDQAASEIINTVKLLKDHSFLTAQNPSTYISNSTTNPSSSSVSDTNYFSDENHHMGVVEMFGCGLYPHSSGELLLAQLPPEYDTDISCVSFGFHEEDLTLLLENEEWSENLKNFEASVGLFLFHLGNLIAPGYHLKVTRGASCTFSVVTVQGITKLKFDFLLENYLQSIRKCERKLKDFITDKEESNLHREVEMLLDEVHKLFQDELPESLVNIDSRIHSRISRLSDIFHRSPENIESGIIACAEKIQTLASRIIHIKSQTNNMDSFLSSRSILELSENKTLALKSDQLAIKQMLDGMRKQKLVFYSPDKGEPTTTAQFDSGDVQALKFREFKHILTTRGHPSAAAIIKEQKSTSEANYPTSYAGEVVVEDSPWDRYSAGIFAKLLLAMLLFDVGHNGYLVVFAVFLLHVHGFLDPILDLISATSHSQPFDVSMGSLRNRLMLQQQINEQDSVQDPPTEEAGASDVRTDNVDSTPSSEGKNSDAKEGASDEIVTPGSDTLTSENPKKHQIQQPVESSAENTTGATTSNREFERTRSADNTRLLQSVLSSDRDSQPPYSSRWAYQLIIMFVMSIFPWWNPNPQFLT